MLESILQVREVLKALKNCQTRTRRGCTCMYTHTQQMDTESEFHMDQVEREDDNDDVWSGIPI